MVSMLMVFASALAVGVDTPVQDGPPSAPLVAEACRFCIAVSLTAGIRAAWNLPLNQLRWQHSVVEHPLSMTVQHSRDD